MFFLLEQKKVTQLENFFIIRDTLISGMCCLEKVGVTDCFNDYLSCLQEIMDKTQDYQKKPLVFMFLWKQALREERDFSLAESFCAANWRWISSKEIDRGMARRCKKIFINIVNQ